MKKYSVSQRLRQIMSEKNLKQVDILDATKSSCIKYNVKLGRNDISQYVSGKVEPRENKLLALAEALGVNEAWLMGYDVDQYRDYSSITCPVCGLSYTKGDLDETELHEKNHEKFVAAKQVFPELISLNEAASTRHRYETLLCSDNLEEKHNGAIGVIRYYFVRSLSSNNYSLRHPNFKKYAAMLLDQKSFIKRFGSVYDKLVDEFGHCKGLQEGRTIIHLEKYPSAQQNEILSLYNQLDVEDKAEIRGEIKQMLKADKYQKPDNSVSQDIVTEVNAALRKDTVTSSN